jgi:hypothetical protein
MSLMSIRMQVKCIVENAQNATNAMYHALYVDISHASINGSSRMHNMM